MSDFTVEATVAPVTDGDWSRLRSIIDLVPGTLLIEDPEEPALIFPVQADDPIKAVLFVDGIAKLVGLEIRSGAVGPTPEVDFELAEVDQAGDDSTRAVEVVNEWVRSVPPLDARITDEGNVEYV